MGPKRNTSRQMDPDDLRFVSEFRSNMYRFFATVYNRPLDRERLDTLCSSHFMELAEGFASVDSTSILKHAVREFDHNLDELRYEYNNLFIVPGTQYLTPYESVYRGTRIENGKKVLGLLNGPETLEVLRYYQSMGYEMGQGKIGPPDYVGTEIEFMYRIISMEQSGNNRNDMERSRRFLEVQKRFFEDHLNQWVPELCRKMIEKTGQPLYKSLAAITIDFLEVEARTFGDYTLVVLPQEVL